MKLGVGDFCEFNNEELLLIQIPNPDFGGCIGVEENILLPELSPLLNWFEGSRSKKLRRVCIADYS